MRVEYRNIRLKRLGETDAPIVPFEQLPQRQSNSEVQPLIESQVAAMLAPAPLPPLNGRMRLGVASRPRYVRGSQTDVVLDFEGQALKIPAVDEPLRHLAYPAEYEFDLEWAAGAYRVIAVRLHDQPFYAEP
jgi:hypothetical protein